MGFIAAFKDTEGNTSASTVPEEACLTFRRWPTANP
jgi:hypothetical protein